MTEQQFIEAIAGYVQKYAPMFNISVCSPVIAQAILESAYGTSFKAQYNNYFGLKYRKDRVTCNSGYFEDGGSEQELDGSYTPLPSNTAWYAFENMDMGVLGYFQYINIERYSNLKGVTDPHKYLENIKADGYATSLTYVENVYAVIKKWNLTKYDNKEVETMSNSPLVTCTVLSPNHSGDRTHSIDRITPHCVVGQLSAKTIGDCFPSGRGASCNYGIGTEGGVSLVVPEKYRSWCSSSNENDQRAVTIECASDKTEPYTMNDTVYNKLIDLCVDICQRNGKTKLLWFADKDKSLSYNPSSTEMVITVHRWFANKSCPGDWLYNRLGDLASKVTARLGDATEETPAPQPIPSTGELYRVQAGAYSSKENAVAQLNAIKAKGFDCILVQVNGLYKVQCGAYSNKTNADNQLKAIQNAGFEAFITTVSGTQVDTKIDTPAPAPTPAKKSVSEVAQEVLNGKWGNGEDRKSALEKAGYNYSEVQNAVNTLVNGSSTPAKKSVTEVAKEVIAGQWGNGADRKANLEKAGYNYSEVQAKVNALL